jgi:hypothetical protein
MKTKQIIFTVLICLMSAFAIITAVLGQSETRIIKIEEAPIENQIIEEPIPTVNEIINEQPSITEMDEIINSTTTDNDATTTTE